MATYFHGNSELIQENGDGLQTLILMNPAYVGYSDTQPTNLVFLNSNSAAAVSPPLESHLHYNPLINTGATARDATRSTQGLSLSLSSNAQVNGFGSETDAGIFRVSKISNGVIQLSSKHLKAAQELLDEVVNVGKEAKINCTESVEEDINEQEKNLHVSTGDGSAELTTSEKHEIQMKKAKLVSMLDEVEQRYKQYQQQVEMVTSWFEQIAGTASAKTYTALALKTISKQFRCLKDAILVQIRAATKNLGEEKIEDGSRLKYRVDNRIGQQRAIEQLGMRQHNAWRPQRGLPDRSVSVLRSWLFEHFLHPYPKDSDKVMLAKQTGLTRSQVSNWFINARVRLWKPMVEEMYAEEMKENKGNIHDQSEDKTESTSKSLSQASPTKRNMIGNNNIIIGLSETESTAQGISPKKPRNHTSIRSTNMELNRDIGFTLTGAPKNYFTEGYPIMEAQKLGSSNGVSLTLGLPHCETLSGAHQRFLSNQIVEADDFNTMNSPTSTSVYESIDVQNRKRFAGQLLPDFVSM